MEKVECAENKSIDGGRTEDSGNLDVGSNTESFERTVKIEQLLGRRKQTGEGKFKSYSVTVTFKRISDDDARIKRAILEGILKRNRT